MGNNRRILHGVSIAVLLLFVFLAIGSTASTPRTSEEYTDRGVEYGKKKDYDKAIEYFDEAIRLNPNNERAYNNRGTAYHYKGNYNKAIADYETALRITPNDTVVKRNLELARQAQANQGGSQSSTSTTQTAAQSSSSYFTGDGGRGIRLAVLAPAGTGLSRDEQWMLSHIQGAITEDFDRYSAMTIVDQQGSNASHVLASSLSKTQSGYTLELTVTDVASGNKVFTYPPTQISLAEIETLSAVKTASSDLLGQMGVNMTARGQQVLAQAHSQEDFEVTQNTDNTLTITNYKGTIKDVVIPGTLYGLKVTSIGSRAFQDKGLTSVVIPDTVITIDDGGERMNNNNFIIVGAFYSNNQLSKVTLGKGLKTIGSYAFYNTKIAEIIIPNSVNEIGDYAFSPARSRTNTYTNWVWAKGTLTKVILGTGLQSIGNEAFRNNQITELNLPTSLREVGKSAFESNQIQKIVFGTGLQTIGSEAFRNNQITELNLPSSLKEIRGGAFANNQIQSVILPNGITSVSNQLGGLGSGLLGVFANNPLTTVVIPASLAKGGLSSERFVDEFPSTFGRRSESKITRITVPAGMDEDSLRANFETAFVNFWISQNKAGGTYVKNGPIWTKE